MVEVNGGKPIMATRCTMKIAAGKTARGELFFNLLIPAMALLVLTSCTTMQAYPGPKLPREQIAVIERRAHYFALIYGLTIYVGTIDGAVVDATASEIEILPGLHELTLIGQATHPLWATPLVLLMKPKFAPNELAFRAEAGRNYKLVTVEVETAAYAVWIENDAGEVVGGGVLSGLPMALRLLP